MSGPQGFSVTIFLPTGQPEALRTVEKSNWTGHGLVFPRVQLPEARTRAEMHRTGVYVLWGPSESGPLPCIYIGEGDPVRPRVDQHAKQKDFWTHAAVFTSKDQSLNKAHVQYLEARLVSLAAAAKRAEIDNANVPQLPALSEADAADAEGFLAGVLLCLPVMGVSLFDQPVLARTGSTELLLKGKGIDGKGRETTDGFVVRVGSRAVISETASCDAWIADLRKSLVKKGVLEMDKDAYRVTQDYVFASPSAAAGVLLGMSVNGRTAWVNAAGRTLKQIQAGSAPRE